MASHSQSQHHHHRQQPQNGQLQRPSPLQLSQPTRSSSDLDGTSLNTRRDQTRRASSSDRTGDGQTKSEGDPGWGLTKAGKIRQRLPLACQVCRKKKIRCSGEHPICKHCFRFSLPCEYKTATSRRPRNSLRRQSTGTPSKKDSTALFVEDRSISPSSPAQRFLNQNRPPPLQPVTERPRSPDVSLDLCDRQEVTGPSTVQTSPPIPIRLACSLTGLSETARPIPSDILGQHQRRGSGSRPDDMSSEIPSRLPSIWHPQNGPPTPPPLNITSPATSVPFTKVETHTPLPPRSVLLKLVDIYFTHVNNQAYGFLHRPTFLRQVEEGSVSDGLLYAICAISARFSAAHAVNHKSINEQPAYSVGEPYAVEARKLALRDFDRPTVQNVQALLLLALHDFGGRKGHKAWMFAGMAIRMASALRLNREVDGNGAGVKNVYESMESQLSHGVEQPIPASMERVRSTEQEVRRRTFWACFITDRLNSTGMERPHVIQENECYVRLPSTEYSFMLGIPIETELLIPSPLSSRKGSLHPPSHIMGSEAYLIRIIALLGRVTKYVNQGGRLYDVMPPWTSESVFTKLSNELQEWTDILPYWLRYSTSNLADQVAVSQAPSFVFMHVAYHTTVCILHRFSVPSADTIPDKQSEESAIRSWNPPADFLQKSIKKCFEHARAITTIMAEVILRSDCVVTAPFIGFATFTANLFHLHQAFTPCYYVDETPEQARGYFTTGITVLNELRMWWGPLEILYKAIHVLWQMKARSSQTQLVNEKEAPNGDTEAAQAFDGGFRQWPSERPPAPSGSNPCPSWMSIRSNSPGRPEFFDTTGLIPLPGGNFGLDFVDPNLCASMKGKTADDMMSDTNQLEAFEDPEYTWFRNLSPTPFCNTLESTSTSVEDTGKSPAPLRIPLERPFSPFSNALHGFGRPLTVKNGAGASLIGSKEEATEHRSILEQIHKNENSPPNPKPWGMAGSTSEATLHVRIVNPESETHSGTFDWPNSSGGHLRSTSAKPPQDHNEGEEDSKQEEAADLLVYFHARSQRRETNAIDWSIASCGDSHSTRSSSGPSAASSPNGLVCYQS